MVSNASEDLPLPLIPVITTSLFFGIEMSMFLRLCSLAPNTSINSSVSGRVSFISFSIYANPVANYEGTADYLFAKKFNKTTYSGLVSNLAQYYIDQAVT